MTVAGPAARHAMATQMAPGYQFQTPWLREAQEKGREEGRAEGKAEERAQAVIAVLAARRIRLTAVERRRVEACRDLETLDRWLRGAATAASASEVFAD